MGTQIGHVICDPQGNFRRYLIGEIRPRASKLNIQLAVEARAIAGRDIDQSFVAQREHDIARVLEEGGAQFAGAKVVFHFRACFDRKLTIEVVREFALYLFTGHAMNRSLVRSRRLPSKNFTPAGADCWKIVSGDEATLAPPRYVVTMIMPYSCPAAKWLYATVTLSRTGCNWALASATSQ